MREMLELDVAVTRTFKGVGSPAPPDKKALDNKARYIIIYS